MNFLWSIHLYPPKHNCGSELMAHQISKYLISQGHTVRVLNHQAKRYGIYQPYELDGVLVFPPTADDMALYRNADIVLTHLEYTWETILNCRKLGKPCVHFVHNSITYQSITDAPECNIVYNSQWVADVLNYPNHSTVFFPPCDYRFYDVNENPEESDFITLINLDWNKGGHLLKEIAKGLPDKKFLGVMGSYSQPADVGQITDQPSNVKVIPNTPDILEVYKQTRVLLMPSEYESWGRTATEAMCNGIPVISSSTPGLKENCSYAGIFINDRMEIKDWISAIKKLDDKKEYKKKSKICKQRSRELDPIEKLKELNHWLTKIGNG